MFETMSGRPLDGLLVLEVAGLAPAPFCGMVLADFGASVVRVDRSIKGFATPAGPDTLARGKRSIALDLKMPEGRAAFAKLAARADVLVEPFRPGVMERLGLGPKELLEANPGLIYARLTGFGQGGDPVLGGMAGHDANYLAMSGTLSMMRQSEDADDLGLAGRPFAPLNILGDFAGGGMLCAMGVLLAVIERHRSGQGQVIDAAMVDGASYLGTSLFKSVNAGSIKHGLGDVGANGFNQGAPWYSTYACADGNFIAVCALEPQFYAALLKGLDLEASSLPRQMDRMSWPAVKRLFADRFRSQPRDHWAAVFHGVDACVTPVLGMREAQTHDHSSRRGAFRRSIEGTGGGFEPAPAPSLSRTPGHDPRPSPIPGHHTAEVLRERGLAEAEVASLLASGAASCTTKPRKAPNETSKL